MSATCAVVVAIRFALENGALTWLEHPASALYRHRAPANRHSPFNINHVARRADG